MNEKRGFLIFFVALVTIGVGLGIWIGVTAPVPPSDEIERMNLHAEGLNLSREMEGANRAHDWSGAEDIRKRDADFRKRADAYLARHGRTPPPPPR